jgi:CBS domain containing-hemolysin-like protein
MSAVEAMLALLALVVSSAVLASVETAATRTDVVRALRLDEEARRGASALLWLVEHRASVVDAVLLLTIAVRVATTLVTLRLLTTLIPEAPGAAIGGGTVAVVVVLSLVLGEAAPRSLTLRRLESVGLVLAVPARAIVRAVSPLARSSVALGRFLASGRSAGDEGPAAPEGNEELGEVVDEEVEPEERRMIRSIFELGDTSAREIMVPRPDMVTVAADAPIDEVLARVVAEGRSRLPVHDPLDADRIVGVVHAKDVLARSVAGDPAGPTGSTGWSDLVREPTFFPESKRADDLLRDLQRAATHLALVVDEYGEVVGLVTIEDILEEIVGEIVDEHDEAEELVVAEGAAFRIDGRLPVDELAAVLGVELPEEPWDSAGGLVFGSLGRSPRVGDRVELEGHRFEVRRVQGRRVAELRVERVAQVEGVDGPGDGGPAAAPGMGGAA